MTKDLTVGNPLRVIVNYMIPVFLGLLLQQAYNLVDTVVVGRFVGANALGGVGAASSLCLMVFGATMGLCSGFCIPIANAFGAKEDSRLRQYLAHAIYLCGMNAGLVMFVFLTFCRPILTAMNTPVENFPFAYDYVHVYFLGIPFSVLYNLASGVIRALGDSKTPLYFLILSALTNIILDLVFVVGFGMGVAGVAIATMIAQALSCVCCHMYVGRKYEIFQLTKETLVFDKDLLKGIIRYGVPSAIQQSVLSLNFMVVQRFVNFFGADMTAAFSVVNKIENFVTMPQMNLAMALSMFAGQNIGAGEEKRAKQGVTDVLKMQVAFWVVILFVLPMVASGLIRMFGMGDDANVMAIGVEAIKLCSKLYILFGFMQTFSNFLRGVGDAKYSMLTTICMILIRLPFTYVLVYMVQYGEMSIWLGMGMGWLTVMTMNIVRYYKGGWRGKAFVQLKK